MKLRFGTAGIPLSAKKQTSEDAVTRIRELGLDALEIEFVHGVKMSEAKAELVGTRARELAVSLSCHAPYYINLNAKDPEKLEASKQRLVSTARMARLLGARSIVFHPAFYMGETSERVMLTVSQVLLEVRELLAAEGNEVVLRPETTGKLSQFGDLAETVSLAQEVPGVLPCIDISHLYARSRGSQNTYEDFCRILNFLGETLGDRWNTDAHFHVAGIAYGTQGETKHLTLAEADLNYRELARAWQAFDVAGTVICESPNLEEDALVLAHTYADQEKFS